MRQDLLFFLICVLTAIGFLLSRSRSLWLARKGGKPEHLHSLPVHHGALTAIWCLLPAIVLWMACSLWEDSVIASWVMQQLPDDLQNLSAVERTFLHGKIKTLAEGGRIAGEITPELQVTADRYQLLQQQSAWLRTALVLFAVVCGFLWSWIRIAPLFPARNRVESVVRRLFMMSSGIAVLATVAIVFSVLFEALRFFESVSLLEFLFGTHWSPQTAIRADQQGASGSFGAIPLFLGTLMITAIAMAIAVPIGLMSAIFLSEYADKRVRAAVKPLLEVLAGIPTVVYGFFAALTVAPFFSQGGASIGLDISSESALAAGLVMGVMIIPFVSSLSDDVINAVPMSMRDGSLALGATRSETVKKVIIPAALPGIIGSILLAISRAIGETMIVVMAAGLAAKLSVNPLESVTTVTVQIVTLLVGDQEFDSPKTLAAFALGLVLFLVTLVLNVIALYVVRKYREQYE